MNTTTRLMLGSGAVALVTGNVLPFLSAALGLLSWDDATRFTYGLNLSLIFPGVIAMLPAAWIQAHDPDLARGRPLLQAAAIVLLAACAYFALMLAWIPLLPRLAPDAMRLPRLPRNVPETLYLALIVVLVCGLPAWLAETVVVRWIQARVPRALHGSPA